MTALRPTIVDIAHRAGVSTGAVSYALNGLPGVSTETRQRILRIADDVGWRPNNAARSLSVSRTGTVGLLIDRGAATSGVETFFMRFLAGLETELSDHHCALLLQVVDSHSAATEAMRTWWAERRIDGVVVTNVWREDIRIPVIHALGLPAVLVGQPREDTALPCIWSDDAAAVTSVVDYLVALGHRRIVRVAGPSELIHTQIRSQAFRVAMERHQLSDPEVVVTDYGWEQGAHATRTLLARAARPTAISYDDDIMAAAGMGVAREMGIRVPAELSLVAGDDSHVCAMLHPALTSLSRDVIAYGMHTARTLLTAIQGGNPTSYQDVTAHLVPRGSTAPAPAGLQLV